MGFSGEQKARALSASCELKILLERGKTLKEQWNSPTYATAMESFMQQFKSLNPVELRKIGPGRIQDHFPEDFMQEALVWYSYALNCLTYIAIGQKENAHKNLERLLSREEELAQRIRTLTFSDTVNIKNSM